MKGKLKASEVWGEKWGEKVVRPFRVSLCESCQAANELFCKFKMMNADRSMIIQSCPKYRKVENGK